MADALSLEHPDVPWTLPAQIPPARDLQLAITALTVAPASPKHASWCLAKLALAFESGAQRLSPEATKLRADVWLEANADLGDELWSKATIAAIRGSKWMPKPAEFRELVSVELAERSKKLSRCRSMLTAGAGASETAKPFVRESQADRLRSMRDSFRKFGNIAKAAQYERESAALDGRQAEDWALEFQCNSNAPATNQPASNEGAKSYTPPSRTAARCAELAQQHHIDRQRDIPEAM